MLRVHADFYLVLGREIEEAIAIFRFIEADARPDNKMRPEERAQLAMLLGDMEKLCADLNLPTSRALIGKRVKDLPETRREFELLVDGVEAEMKSRLFFYMPWERSRYYETELHLDANMLKAFPNASKELVHAGNCYALAEYTASVFHAMRSAEIALRAVSKSLTSVTLPADLAAAEWQTLINLIDGHIKALQQTTKTPQRDEDLKFYSDANSQFTNFKEAFRKYVAHARDTYEEVPCISVLHRTREFLEVLSKRISE
jgi:hypothetical protein